MKPFLFFVKRCSTRFIAVGLTVAVLGIASVISIPTVQADPPAPAPTVNNFLEKRGRCSFSCAPRATPGAGYVQPQIIVGCNENADCVPLCAQRCITHGPAGNGLTPADGTNLVCGTVDTAHPITCVLPPPAGITPTDTGGTGSSGRGGSGGQTANTATSLPNPVGTTDLVALLGRVVKSIMAILGALTLMWMVWGGVLWMTAEESKRTEDAKTIMKNAALGIVLLFFSYGLTTAFLGIFQEAASNEAPPVTAPTPTPARTTPTPTPTPTPSGAPTR